MQRATVSAIEALLVTSQLAPTKLPPASAISRSVSVSR
jgi:hypothetical protein